MRVCACDVGPSVFSCGPRWLLTFQRCPSPGLPAITSVSQREAAAVVESFEDLKTLFVDNPEYHQILTALLAFADDVDDVRRYVMTNAQALVKICKKHDKNSAIAIKQHYLGVLRRCTFYNSRTFGALIADTVVLAIVLIELLTGRQCQPKYDFRWCACTRVHPHVTNSVPSVHPPTSPCWHLTCPARLCLSPCTQAHVRCLVSGAV